MSDTVFHTVIVTLIAMPCYHHQYICTHNGWEWGARGCGRLLSTQLMSPPPPPCMLSQAIFIFTQNKMWACSNGGSVRHIGKPINKLLDLFRWGGERGEVGEGWRWWVRPWERETIPCSQRRVWRNSICIYRQARALRIRRGIHATTCLCLVGVYAQQRSIYACNMHAKFIY